MRGRRESPGTRLSLALDWLLTVYKLQNNCLLLQKERNRAAKDGKDEDLTVGTNPVCKQLSCFPAET